MTVSRYERLSAGDYHLGLIPAQTASAVEAQRGALEALAGFGTDMWNAAINPRSLFSSGASVRSGRSGEDSSAMAHRRSNLVVHPNLVKPGVKIFVQSPYDCIVSTKRDLGDHLGWLLERKQYQASWELLNEHPEILSAPWDAQVASPLSPSLPPHTMTGRLSKSDVPDLDEHNEASSTAASITTSQFSAVEKEKRRIADLWLKSLVDTGDWSEAARICTRVLTTASEWETWIWVFAGAKHFDEIADAMPSRPLVPPISGTVYEVVLGHFVQNDKLRFQSLLDRWAPEELFDSHAVATALENQLAYRDVREGTTQDGVLGRDWRIVMESLARLYESCGRQREALRCCIRLHDADAAFRLIRDFHLADAVVEDVPRFIMLRVPADGEKRMSDAELQEATEEAITLLVDEAQRGLVRPNVVVEQLQDKSNLRLYLYLYLAGLYRGTSLVEQGTENRDRLVEDSKSLVDEFANLAVSLFAKYDRPLLMALLQSSTSYNFDKVRICPLTSYTISSHLNTKPTPLPFSRPSKNAKPTTTPTS